MSLDIHLNKNLSLVWEGNITHNMVEMANEIVVRFIDGKPKTAFCYIWNPHDLGIFLAKDMVQYLKIIIINAVSRHNLLVKFNPENGWGSYDVFLQFLVEYFLACQNNPDSYIEVFR